MLGIELIEAAVLNETPEVRRAAGKVDVFAGESVRLSFLAGRGRGRRELAICSDRWSFHERPSERLIHFP